MLRDRDAGCESGLIISGAKGSGKTRAFLHLLAHNGDIAFLRAKAAYTGPGWLLRDLCRELGILAYHSIEATYRAIVDYLREVRKIIVIDEAQYLTHNFRLAEIVKNLNDEAGTGFVFLTEIGGEKLFMRFGSLFDRVAEIIVFKPLTQEDITLIIEETMEMAMSPDAIEGFCGLVEPRMRPLIISLARLERWARVLKKSEITGNDVRGMFHRKGSPLKPSEIIKAKGLIAAA